MWKVLPRLLLSPISLVSIIYTRLATKFYKIKKSNYKLIDLYNNYLEKNLTNEGVHFYISNIKKLPKIYYNKIQSDTIRELYRMVLKNNAISADLKVQLRLALRSKGIDKI
jgi:type III secretory pathway component EscR